jgi:hypothetical protein
MIVSVLLTKIMWHKLTLIHVKNKRELPQLYKGHIGKTYSKHNLKTV